MEAAISFFGLFVMMILAWLMSPNRRIVSLRVVFGGLALQFLLAYLTLRTVWGQRLFQAAGDGFNVLLGYVNEGSKFVFGIEYERFFFAFKILPTIVFFSALMTVLYHLRVMQILIRFFAVIMQRTLGTSGAETLSTSANIFVGQTEAPLVVKPYISDMTQSELMCIMIGGFATTAGGVLAACVGMGIDAGHLMAASVIAAPATIVISKLIQPEVETPLTLGRDAKQPESQAENLVHAMTLGAADGLVLAFNVAACIIVFLAFIALANGCLAWIAGQFGYWTAVALGAPLREGLGGLAPDAAPDLLASGFCKSYASSWTLERIFGCLFAPLAWCLGISWQDSLRVGELLGVRMVSNELIAYQQLAVWMKAPVGVDGPVLSDRAIILATYALSGFANFGSIGIQVGGIGPMAPDRQKDVARLGLRAMLGGTLATLMTACVAGIFLSPDDIAAHRLRLEKSKIIAGSLVSAEATRTFPANDLVAPEQASAAAELFWRLDGRHLNGAEVDRRFARSVRQPRNLKSVAGITYQLRIGGGGLQHVDSESIVFHRHA